MFSLCFRILPLTCQRTVDFFGPKRTKGDFFF